MRILSFSQPWCWGIFNASKRIENRSWLPPIECIGQRFIIHAAKSWDADAIGFFLRLGLDGFPGRKDLYPSACVVGVATITRCVTKVDTLPPDQHRWYFGPCGWLLEDVRELAADDRIPWKGAQGLRHATPELVERVNAVLPRARICA